jgi:hypothetical protein
VGLIYFLVGGGWLIVSRLGAQPLGFGDTTVLLTAVHFHYAGPVASIIAGLVGRHLWWSGLTLGPIYRLSAIGVVLAAAALALAASLIALAMVTVRLSGTITSRLAAALVLVSAVASTMAMLFAAGYGIGQGLRVPTVSLATMVRVHGLLNAGGFAICGLLGWTIVAPTSRLVCPFPPFSRLAGRGRIGADFFERTAAVRGHGRQPTGLVDTLEVYRRPDFDPDQVPPAVREFYENTGRFGLLVRAQWHGPYHPASRIYKRLSRMTGQMNFPVEAGPTTDSITSRIVALDDTKDGRTNVRAWVRSYSDTGEAIYVAAYATHSLGSKVYMNIAFPLPLGNLTSILRLATFDTDDDRRGVLLTTLAQAGCHGDEGVYFANRVLPIRLPFNETIRVWAVPEEDRVRPDDGATVAARHDVWLFGTRLLTLHYAIRPT